MKRAILRWIVPVDRSEMAIKAGWLGLLSVLPIFPCFILGPFAIACGIDALRDLKKNPTMRGKGRAWFGIIMGGIGTVFLMMIIASLTYHYFRYETKSKVDLGGIELKEDVELREELEGDL